MVKAAVFVNGVFPAVMSFVLLSGSLKISSVRGLQRVVQPAAFGNVSSSRRRTSSCKRIASCQFSSASNDNVVSSVSSNTAKLFIALQKKSKKRREYGETIVEGPRIILDMAKNPRTRSLIRSILVSEESYHSWENELRDISPKVIQLATASVLNACSDTVTPQGILARVQIPQVDTSLMMQQSQKPLFLVLDGLQDPGNVGTILRSSLAVGVTAVLMMPECCDVWNPKAVRSAMGSSFSVPIVPVSSWDEAVRQLECWGCQQIWAATMLDGNEGNDSTSGDHSHYQVDWVQKSSALVIGNEGTGLSMPVRESLLNGKSRLPVHAVHVPMKAGIESLNAAICGSIILFEYQRQCDVSSSQYENL